jgi:SNF2 family DNA or RNA helicase
MLDLPSWQRKIYNKAHDELVVEITKDKNLTVATALAKLTRLKQIAVHPQATLGIEAKHTPVKIEALQELLDNRPNKKTLIFTKYATVAKEVAALCAKRKGMKVFLLTGETKMDERPKMEERFQGLAPTDEAVWISTIDAGGMGLTLTAADTVVFMDKDWRPKINEQAEDRAHRIGQKDNVLVVSLIARDTVEERIENVLDKKRDMFNSIVEKDGGVVNVKLTVEDIKDLL